MARPPHYVAPPEDPLPDRENAAEYHGEMWIKYPLASAPLPVHFGLSFNVMCEFKAILNDMLCYIFSPAMAGKTLSLDEAILFQSKLVTWYKALPEPLSAGKIVLPMHLSMQ